jgi:hypothetical protein
MFAALAGGDYVLWELALSGNHRILAAITGLGLPPLLIALLWTSAVAVMRILAARAERRPRATHRTGAPARRPVRSSSRAPRRGFDVGLDADDDDRPRRSRVAA